MRRTPGNPLCGPMLAFVAACSSGTSSRMTSLDAAAVPPAATDAGRAPGLETGDDGGAPAPRITTVFLIMMENKNWSELQGTADAPFLNQNVFPRAAIAPNYKGALDGTLHPSEPNYLWLEAGDNLGITNDDDPAKNHQATTSHLVTLLERAGVSWKSYQEDIAGDVCPLTAVKNYVPRHNPMVFFDDVTNKNDKKAARCVAHVRPLSELGKDLKNGTLARYNLITPNLCNDMHDACAPMNNRVKQGDAFLASWIPRIEASAAYTEGGAIFIATDEAEQDDRVCPNSDCPVGMSVLSPLARAGYVSGLAYDHSSTLKTLQEIFGVTPLLRAAGGARVHDLSDLFVSFP